MQVEGYLICMRWLNSWTKGFLLSAREPPGPISNHNLVDASGNPLPDMQLKRDYCRVCPTLWRYLQSRYGGGPEIKRIGWQLYGK